MGAAGAGEERKHLSGAGFHKEMECFLCRELPKEKEHFMSVGGPKEKECFSGVDAKVACGEKEHFSNVGHPSKSEHFSSVGHPSKNELSSGELPEETDSLGSIGFTAEGECFANIDAQGAFDERGDFSTYSSVAIQTEMDHFSSVELAKKSRRFSSAGPSREKEHFALVGLPKERSKQFSPVDMERSGSKKRSSSVERPDKKERSTSSYSLQSSSGTRPKPMLLDFYRKEWVWNFWVWLLSCCVALFFHCIVCFFGLVGWVCLGGGRGRDSSFVGFTNYLSMNGMLHVC